VIGVKVWVYKGEVLDGGRRDSMRNEGEPRGAAAKSASRSGSSANATVAARVPRPNWRVRDASASGGHAKPANAPIIPPLSVPVAPSWKQEQKRARLLPHRLRRAPRRRLWTRSRRVASSYVDAKKVKFRKQQRGRMTARRGAARRSLLASLA